MKLAQEKLLDLWFENGVLKSSCQAYKNLSHFQSLNIPKTLWLTKCRINNVHENRCMILFVFKMFMFLKFIFLNWNKTYNNK